MIDPDIEPKLRRRNSGFQNICGVDEVGRGPWAGPVTACAVILDPAHIPQGLADSKKLSALRREALCRQILATADVGIAHVSVEQIDRINILQASLLAMRLAIAKLGTAADFALIDGNKTPPGLACPSECLVKGDGRSQSIAAASIVAKVTRDALMGELSQRVPGYGWHTNAGYGTREHADALAKFGVTEHHRRSFKPIQKLLRAS